MVTFKKWFNILYAPILGIASFIIIYFFLNNYTTNVVALNAVPALSASILFMVLAQNIKVNQEIEKTSIVSDKVYEAIKNYLHVIQLGSPETAIVYINSKFSPNNVPQLRAAYNTSFNLEDEIDDANDRFYMTKEYSDFQNNMTKNIGERQNFLWKELGDETALPRFRKMHNTIQGKEYPDKYKYKHIPSLHGPQINFIILEYTDDKKEVLFNWDFRSPGQVPVVLLSRDEKIINMFAVHFSNQWKAAVPDHDINQKE